MGLVIGMRTLNFLYLFLVLFFVSCSNKELTRIKSQNAVPDHSGWTELLQQYVDQDGMVDYSGFVKDSVKLKTYTNLLTQNYPGTAWSKNEQLAYWINAYNAFTVMLIVDNYPVESIKDLNPSLTIPTIRSVWTKEWFKIGDEDFSLDFIEHKILRKEFDEPRIHFAINCASYSCPVLRAEAYYGDKIEAQLNEQARLFINDESRNTLRQGEVKLSLIFNWFGGDFKKGQSLIQFINRYADVVIDVNAKISFAKYDWKLNDSKGSLR